MTVEIRKILPRDNEALASIIRKVFDEFNAPKKGTVYSDSTTDQLYELFENTPNSTLFVAEENGELLGCCGVFPTEGLQASYAELVKFYLKKSARGRSIGKSLFEKTIDEARSLGYQYLYIESGASFNQAVKMYQAYNFKFIDSPLGNSGHDSCDIWMLKKL